MDDTRLSPAHALHVLVARLDRAADRILAEHSGLTYRRFLALLTIERLGAGTQRAVAEQLGISEPSASRIVAGLAEEGLVDVARTPGAGNRRTVTLTAAGARVLGACSAVLEESFAGLAESAGVDIADLDERVHRLLAALP